MIVKNITQYNTSGRSLWFASAEEVHLWPFWLDNPPLPLPQLKPLLSQDELERANRFYFNRDRDRFTVGRALLRVIISQYIGTSPEAIQFSYEKEGKPRLPGPLEKGQLVFNLSHSHQMALVGLTANRQIGVDLEFIRPVEDLNSISENFFALQERTVLRSLPQPQKLEAFFRCWTRKEAYLKATGSGLSHPLDQFEVSLAPGEPARLLKVVGEPLEPERWTLFEPAVEPGYLAALAIEGSISALSIIKL